MCETYVTDITHYLNEKGELTHELGRTNSLGYSMYALNAMVQTAEIARHFEVDLYDFAMDDGRGLKKALDYHAPFCEDPSGWPYQQTSAYKGGNAALYEPAFSRFEETSYEVFLKYT